MAKKLKDFESTAYDMLLIHSESGGGKTSFIGTLAEVFRDDEVYYIDTETGRQIFKRWHLNPYALPPYSIPKPNFNMEACETYKDVLRALQDIPDGTKVLVIDGLTELCESWYALNKDDPKYDKPFTPGPKTELAGWVYEIIRAVKKLPMHVICTANSTPGDLIEPWLVAPKAVTQVARLFSGIGYLTVDKVLNPQDEVTHIAKRKLYFKRDSRPGVLIKERGLPDFDNPTASKLFGAINEAIWAGASDGSGLSFGQQGGKPDPLDNL